MWALAGLTVLLMAIPGHTMPDHIPDDVEAYLIFSSQYRIVRFNVDVTDSKVLQQDTHDTVALDFDYEAGLFYWSDQDDKKIYRAPLDGGNKEVVVSTGDDSQVDGVAVDWVNNQLYWTDLAFGTISRLNLNGFTDLSVVIATNAGNPRGIVLDPRNDVMYFTNVNNWAPNIQRARMSNGTQQQVIVSRNLLKPNAITMDYDTDRLYFADAWTDRIESCNVDGSDRTVLLNRRFYFHPFDLTLYDDRIYWTDLYQHTIVSAHKDTGGDRIFISGPFVFPHVIHAVHPSRQLSHAPNYCEANGGRGMCESNCTAFSTGYSCSCNSGYALNDDLLTCSDINECGIDNGGCSHHCNNMEGTFQCQCIDGFALLPDGVTCADNNECNNNRGGCEYACHNTDSGYYCSCSNGYELRSDQRTCQDINECLPTSPCPVEAQCINQDGSYRCMCPNGYIYDTMNGICADVDECLAGQGTCTQRCDNQPGSFSCSCHDGFVLDGDGVSCSDVNECEDSLHACQQNCVNIIGSFVCLCNDGFQPVGDGQSCIAIDCGQPGSIDGFNMSCTGTTYGSRCSLSCIQGTRIGSSTIICQQNGVWSVSTAECIATEDTEGVNDPPLAIVPSSFSIPEDTVNGTVLGMLHTVDPDNHQSYTYTLTSDPSGKFYIDTSGDTLKTHGGFDYETDPAYTIHVTSVDSGTPPLSGTFDLSISILDVNETPRKPTLTSNTIGEHAAVGDQVGTILASDPDQGQDQTFSLLSSGHGKFDIQGDQLLVAGSLNFEHVNTYSVVVQVEDSGSPRLSNVMTFAIMVQDENDAPTAVRLSATAIPETSPDSATAVGTVIGVLTTNDEDRGDSHTYTLQGPLSSCFSISNSDLTVAETSCFDHEINPSIPLNITSTDSAGLTIQHMFTISVTDVNDPPFGILLSSSTVQEHIAVNTIVGTLTVEDPDQGDTHQLSIVTGGSLFAVHGNALAVSADLSYTDYPTGITVAIQATDTGNQSYIEMFSISVQNVNEPPNDINWQVTARCTPEEESITGVSIHACVTENTAPDTLIATAVVTDPDFDTVSLQIIDSANIFVLDQSGALKVGQQGLNFESPLVGEVHSVFVVAEDPGRLTSTSQFTVKIINENDPPTRVEISRTFVGASTAIGQSAAVLQCIDEDATDTHTFSLVNNTENMFAIVGNELRVQQDLSALAGNQFAIEVQCSDGAAELMTPATFVITVYRDSASGGSGSAINISLSHSSISEQQPANTLVGTLSAEIMPTSLFNFTIVGGASRLFSIQPGVGGNPPELRTTQPLDFEEASMHYVIIRAETGENSAVNTFLITVLDVNEPPGSLTFHYSPVHENQQGALVGIVSAIDPDEGDTVTFQILNDPSSAFDLQDGATLNSKRVVTRRAVDFEMETSLSLVLAARDPHALALVSESPEYIIQVLNINEAPTDILISQAAIDENRAQGTVIGTLSVIDPDTPRTQQHFICSLQDSAQGLFRLNGFDIEVFQSQRLDYEIFAASGKMPTVVVECSDDGSLSVSRHFEITVRDVAEQPYDIQSATGVYEIMENNEAGAVIAHLNTLDPDTVDQSTFLYTVSDRDTFEIVGNMLIAQIQLNYERRRFYDIQITTTDADGLSFTEGVTVTVLDGNDPPTGIVMTQISTLSADSPSGMVIATLDAIDEDRAQQHQFNIQTQTPGGALQITSGNKLAVANGTLHEHSVQVTFVVRDLNGVTLLIHVQTFTISVLGVNLSPTDIQLTGSSVLEGSVVGTVVGNIQVQDPSDSDQRFYCTLLDDAGGRFDIVNFGGEIQLQVAYSEGLDFETASSHSIRISCRDSLPQNTIEKTFVIDVLDGPERPTGIVFTNAADDDTTTNVNPPNLSNFQGHVITLPIATIREDAQDGIGIVAYVTVIAADGTPASDQSALVSSLISENEYNRLNRLGRRKRAALRLHARSKREAGNVPFVIPEIGQYILVSGALDHETQREYMLYVKASYRDTPNLVVTGQLRVVVFDVDEAPLDMSLSPITVSEGASIDTQVGQLSVNDPDGTQTAYVYTMISLGTPFYIQQHRVLVQRLLDHETTPIITIQVKVAELNTNLELVKNFDIGITDTPEPPTALTVDGNTTLTIPETLNVGESLGNFVVTDPDTAGGFAFSFFVDEDSHSFFSISGDQLLLARRLDAWTTNVLSLFIQVTDPTYLSFRQVITVRVTSDDRCSQPGYCSPYATCLRGFCTCKAGFTGDGFTCSDIDECTPFPCHVLHSIPGQCVNGFGGIRNFSCSCLPGWSGRDCTMEVDSCQQNQCSPLGTVKCVNVANTVRYTCECKRGFEGPLCDGDADDCADHQCQNGAKCIDGVGIYTCQCVAPYEGYFCELDPRLCDGAKCAYNGSCIPLPNGQHECRCSDPILSDCSGCAFGYGGENCKPCDPPFTGQNCDIDSRICDPNPCTYGGVCIPDVDKYSCVCPENLATKECTPQVVPLGTGNDNGTDHGTLPIWTVIVIVLVLVAIVIGMVFLMVRRYRRVPYKGSDPFLPWRARFRSDSEQVMVTPDQDHRTQHHPSMDFIPEDYQTQDNPPQDYPPVDYAERDYPMDGNEEAKVQVASSVPTPTEAVAKASTPEAPAAVSTGAEALPTAAKAEDTKQIPKDKPPPYSPPDNLFLASALGLLPPGYEVKGQQVDINSGKEKQEKAQMGGDLAVAQFMETLAMPLSDRGTLQAKGSNLDQWEQAQLGLVKENVPEQGDKRVRKKSAGRRPSVTRKHSVGAVAYQNPIFIPENPVLSKQAATEMRQDGESSVGAVQPPSQSSPQSVSGNRKTSTSATLNGNHDDITEDQNRSNKLSLTKSPSDITKQNPIFQDSDNEDLDDDPFE